MKIQIDGEVQPGGAFQLVVTSERRLSRVAVSIGRLRLHEASLVQPPYHATVEVPERAIRRTLRVHASDAIGNHAEERRVVGAVSGSAGAPWTPFRAGGLTASDAVIAWTGNGEAPAPGKTAPPGSIAVGPFSAGARWADAHNHTGGAVYARRRKLRGVSQRFGVMCNWYQLVYVHGIDPYIAHRAFLEIEDYLEIIKEREWGPGEDEPGYDPEIGPGRVGALPRPAIEVIPGDGGSILVWPKGTNRDG